MDKIEQANVLVTAISTLGFPIVSFFVMYKLVNDIRKDNDTKALADRERDDKLTATINNNTVALTELSTRLGGK